MVQPTQVISIFYPDGAASVGPDEGGVRRVPGSNPGPFNRQQSAAHHQVSGFTDRHPGGRSESHSREPRAKPVSARLLSQGQGIPHHQSPCQGTYLVSQRFKESIVTTKGVFDLNVVWRLFTYYIFEMRRKKADMWLLNLICSLKWMKVSHFNYSLRTLDQHMWLRKTFQTGCLKDLINPCCSSNSFHLLVLFSHILCFFFCSCLVVH